MKKILLLAALLLTAMQAWAAPVDEASARAVAQRFLQAQVDQGRLTAHGARHVELGLAMPGSKGKTTPAFYIFNSDGGFVIVSGDDRAKEVLAYGEGSVTNLQELPTNMRFWLSFYQRQLQFLQERPDLVVERSSSRLNASIASVNPLITAVGPRRALLERVPRQWRRYLLHRLRRDFTGHGVPLLEIPQTADARCAFLHDRPVWLCPTGAAAHGL
jgi:hypothetical protein